MAIVIPGKMFSSSFRKQRLRPELLSRTLEDAGTVTSVLIPWNTCGATQASILGVSTALYAPYAFFCYISPLMTLLFAWMNIRIKHTEPETAPETTGETSATDKRDKNSTAMVGDNPNDKMQKNDRGQERQ